MKLRYYLRGLGIGILVTAFLMGAASGGRKGTLSDEEIKARAAELGMVENMVLSDLDGAKQKEAEDASEPGEAIGGSGEPSGSGLDTESAEPSGSMQPSEDRESAENTEPREDKMPSESKAPTDSTEPSGSKEPADSTEPSGSKEPADSTEPSGSKAPADSTEPSESKAPADSTEPSDSTKPSEDSGASATVTIKRGDSSVAVSKALEAAGLVADAKEYDRFLCAGGYDKKLSVGTYDIPAGAGDEEIARIITGKR